MVEFPIQPIRVSIFGGNVKHSMADSPLQSQITADAAKAKATNVAGTQVNRRDLTELIETDRFLASNDGVKKVKHRGLRFNKISPPGTV